MGALHTFCADTIVLWKNMEHLQILLSGFLLSRILEPQYLFLGILKDDITILPTYENSYSLGTGGD